jgi:magnesium transporter
VEHGETSLAVVDGSGRFVGVVPPRRLLAVLLAEHEEDLVRLSGVLRSTRSARRASEEPVGRRIGHRLPWLVLGLLGALASAGIVSSFERDLESTITLAFFLPGVVYMADAVGTQTEALVIRGLSVGLPIGRVVRRELLTGLVVGVVIAAAFLPAGLAAWDDTDVAITVAVALFAACSTATLVAMTLPWLFSRLGADPAFGSGPLAPSCRTFCRCSSTSASPRPWSAESRDLRPWDRQAWGSDPGTDDTHGRNREACRGRAPRRCGLRRGARAPRRLGTG